MVAAIEKDINDPELLESICCSYVTISYPDWIRVLEVIVQASL